MSNHDSESVGQEIVFDSGKGDFMTLVLTSGWIETENAPVSLKILGDVKNYSRIISA